MSSAAQPAATMITVPSPKGRWKRRPSARARSRASTPSAVRITPASTSENGPKVLTISSTEATAATFCSKPSRRQSCTTVATPGRVRT